MFRLTRKLFTSSVYSLPINCRDFRQSYTQGNTFESLKYMTIGQQISLSANMYKEALALHSSHQGETFYSYEHLDYEVSKVARGFIGLGIQLQEAVGLYAPNCNEWAISQYACSRSGAVLVNINPAYQTKDLQYTLNKTKITTLIMPKQMKLSNYVQILNTIDPGFKDKHQNKLSLNLKNLPYLKRVILLDEVSAGESTTKDQSHYKTAEENNFITWDEFIDIFTGTEHQKELDRRQEHIKPEDPTNIQFTSGTTGLPKGALLSHFNILNNGNFIGKSQHYSINDKIVIQVPLYHCFGTVMGNLACVTNGAASIYPNATFDAQKSLETIEKLKATSLYGVPTMFLDVLNKQKIVKKNISSLKKGIMAGSVCPEYLMNRVVSELGMEEFSICYGMTELSPITHQTSVRDSFYHRVCSVGRNLPHTETKIVDDEGKIVPRGVEGEVLSRSFGSMIGYFEDENATKNSIDEDGFMRTGDYGKIDEDGYLYIVGRKKDTIIRGGENISPKEIEDYLGTHPKIDMVQVVGVKDLKFGDEICAWVKLKEGENSTKEEIAKYCKEKLAHYKIPRYIRFVTSFPMTVTNKPQKFIMKDVSNTIIETGSEDLKVDLKSL